jgi:hypothetical protein
MQLLTSSTVPASQVCVSFLSKSSPSSAALPTAVAKSTTTMAVATSSETSAAKVDHALPEAMSRVRSPVRHGHHTQQTSHNTTMVSQSRRRIPWNVHTAIQMRRVLSAMIMRRSHLRSDEYVLFVCPLGSCWICYAFVNM